MACEQSKFQRTQSKWCRRSLQRAERLTCLYKRSLSSETRCRPNEACRALCAGCCCRGRCGGVYAAATELRDENAVTSHLVRASAEDGVEMKHVCLYSSCIVPDLG
eukprot:4549130-Pleurochrysis_carterae.AAC.3